MNRLFRYSQQIEVTDEEYLLLKKFEGVDVREFAQRENECYHLINRKIDHGDIIDAREEYMNILFKD